MKRYLQAASTIATALFCLNASATDHFVSPTGGNVPPFADWAGAATNIQDAIDVALAGDVVWVTNGVYNSGGKVMAGDLTNIVALDKPLTVQSVNGPKFTTILGSSATNGPTATRCAWLTNGAFLSGFTMRNGATRTTGDVTTLQNGGGAWCASSNAIVGNCMIISNTCASLGGGAYLGSLRNCLVLGNRRGVDNSILLNCTVVSNSVAGASFGSLTNCIIYFNANNFVGPGISLSYCCCTPPGFLPGNIGSDPQLLGDGFHLANTSPCRAAGTNLVLGTDIDGDAWGNPPPIGCDQWTPAPLILPPTIKITTDPIGFTVTAGASGLDTITYSWMRDGIPIENDAHFNAAHTTNLVALGVSLVDPGAYQLIASNSFGAVTSSVATLAAHYVNSYATAPTPPYETWATAATNIQDAIDAALAEEIVFVTNGLYAGGGKTAVGGNLTNRVAIDKPLIVQSVNGAPVTTIQGAWDPTTTNGPLSIRCVWMTNRTVINGFTIRNGSTRWRTDPAAQVNGGGIYAPGGGITPTNSTVANCIITNNAASISGGGAYRVILLNCVVTSNRSANDGINSSYGGGATVSDLRNCLLIGNYAGYSGGGVQGSRAKNCLFSQNSAINDGAGASQSALVNCTLTRNTAGNFIYGSGGGVSGCTLTNSLVYNNIATEIKSTSNYYNSTFSYCCTAPLTNGPGNIAVDPQLLPDGVHLTAGSPCRGAGLGSVITGLDIDGQPWANPPSIGCDEWAAPPVIAGPLVIGVSGAPLALNIRAIDVAGQDPFTFSWYRDGILLMDDSHYSFATTTNLVVNGFGPADAGNYELIASNVFGMATSSVRVVVHCANVNGTTPLAPYSGWSTAATTIQDAVDAASPGEFVLVTNGIYSAGGRAMTGTMTNRVVIPAPVTVASINGADTTIIQGQFDPVSTNGPLAIRCVWMADGSVLQGFTLCNGATLNIGLQETMQSGGGVWGYTNATLINCVLTNNAAGSWGGGGYQGTIKNSKILNNRAALGGGAYQSILNDSLVQGNTAPHGAGVNNCVLSNCTVTANTSAFPGAAVESSFAANSIVYYNFNNTGQQNWAPGPNLVFYFSCTTPLPSGGSNITADPQLLGATYLPSTSPCFRAGSSLYASGTDLDGEPWANPPSMGCDELYEGSVAGPLTVGLTANTPIIVQGKFMLLAGQIYGRATRTAWDFGDGNIVTNRSFQATSYSWPNTGDYTVTFTAFNAEFPDGVSTNIVVHVVPLEAPALTAGKLDGANFTFSFIPQPGPFYYVEETTNLTPPVAWLPVSSTTVISTNPILITDPKATNLSRFYRVRAQ